ncbi:MAG: aldolase [Dictyoglomi bacterium]|jgi:4-hydroxy-2-oxoheptanedioate aldolase|nr:aldolase [Dictyoglomota bacterium]HHV81839.1 aldolase [bacterium]
MDSKILLSALKERKQVYGTLIVSTSPRWTEEVKKTEIDFVFIDTEHMPIERDKLSWMCQTYKALNLAPIVRIPSPDPYTASMVLDGGADGIIIPYVETVEQVKSVCGAVKYGPLKGKRLKNFLDGKEDLEPNLKHYLLKRNADKILIINIESKPAIDSLDEILGIEEIDAILIGPHDLSCSLGIPEDYGNPLFDNAIRTIIRKAKERGISVGIHYFWGLDQEISWAKEGLNMIIHSSDMVLFRDALKRELDTIKSALKD